MRRTRSRHVGRSVLSGATTPNRNGLVIAWNPRTRAMSGPVTRHTAACDLLPTPSDAAATPKSSMNAVDGPVGSRDEPDRGCPLPATGAALAAVAAEGYDLGSCYTPTRWLRGSTKPAVMRACLGWAARSWLLFEPLGMA